MKRYTAGTTISGVSSTREVRINGDFLDPANSQAVYNHSPDGFNWGYNGSGPSQLALAIMLIYLHPNDAVAVYREFREEVIAYLPQGKDFRISVDLSKWIDKARGK